MAGDESVPMIKPLIGTDEATIDDKGRLLVSKKKRERLGEDFVMALGATGCVVVYPELVWGRMVAEILGNSSTNQGRQRFTRLMVGSAEDDMRFDRQGRVVVPQKLRDAAKLTDAVLVVGCVDRLEIWAADEWVTYQADTEGYARDRQQAFDRAHRQMLGGE